MHGTAPGSVPLPLTGYGGLVTLADPTSVPEGASPRTYDTDFLVGQAGTRAGLSNVYTKQDTTIGPASPSAAASATWSSPAHIIAADGSFTSFSPVAQPNYIDVYEYAFNVPATDGVTGAILTLKGFSNVPASIQAQLLINGTPTGEIKTLVLPQTNGTVSTGSATDSWQLLLSPDTVNGVNFGVRLTAISTGYDSATAFLDTATLELGLQTGTSNFQYVGTFTSQAGDVKNISMDANGNLYVEDVTNAPRTQTLVLGGITPNSHIVSVNGADVAYLAITDGSTGSDMPLQYTADWIDRITQVGPGAAPVFIPVQANNDNFAIGSISQPAIQKDQNGNPFYGGIYFLWSAGPGLTTAGNIITIYYGDSTAGSPLATAVVNQFASGQPTYLSLNVTGIPVPYGPTTVLLTAAPAAPAQPPGQPRPFYYFCFQVATSNNVYYQGSGHPSYEAAFQLTLATIQMAAGVSVPGIVVGNSVSITDATPTSWNNTWAITQTPTSATMQITQTSVTGGLATFTYALTGGSLANPVAGQLVTITGSENPDGNLNLVNAVINTANGTNQFTILVSFSGSGITTNELACLATTAGTEFCFDPGVATLNTGTNPIYGNTAAAISITAWSITTNVVTFTAANSLAAGDIVYLSSFPTSTFFNGQTVTVLATGLSGTAFEANFTHANGSATESGSGSTAGVLTFASGSAQLIGPGTRQGTVFFITRNGYYTCPAPPVTFVCPSNTSAIAAFKVPLGPPNVVARGIAFTEAGQNGVPGANFFTIPTPVSYIVNDQKYTTSALIINDNTTTSINFQFTDSVLLNALAIDVYGYNLFNQIEIGDPGWVASYGARNAYGLCRNKLQNFVNLSFDGGYLPSSQLIPLGWTQPDVYGSLVTSPKFGNSYYIKNTTAGTLSVAGLIQQTAYQDAYNVAIVQPNTTYSVRVGARIPSGLTVGNLVIALVAGGVTYGSYTLPFSSMKSSYGVYSGTLVTSALAVVPPGLILQVSATSIGASADVEIDRVEVYPTEIPILTTTVFFSYAGLPEQVDSITGAVVFTSENQQAVNGAIVMYDTFYAAKGWLGKLPGSSLYSLQKASNLEPAQWDEPEVAQRAGGAVGVLAFDSGEQWFVGANRAGLYLFVGGQPGKISQEIFQVWDAINWAYGDTIWVKVDINARRIFVGVPMPTPNFWLPNAATNANPTSPNVILMCNYQGLDSGEALKVSPQMHTTMFGTLNAIDMRRKWSIWQVPSPYANIVQGQTDEEIYICNGNGSSKIYRLDDTVEQDDGVIIDSLYTTAGLPELSKRMQMPQLGRGRVRWDYMTAALTSGGLVNVKLYANRLFQTVPSGYQWWQVPGGFAPGEGLDDIECALNFVGRRTFWEFRENDGFGFTLSNLVPFGKQDVWNRVTGQK